MEDRAVVAQRRGLTFDAACECGTFPEVVRWRMLFDFAELPARERHKLMIGTIVPRPIAWVVTQSAAGRLNAAPFSFFNAFASDPPVVGVGIGSHPLGRPKDTRVNIKETGQFVVNLVSDENARAMNVTAIGFDYGVDEVAQAGLTVAPSIRVSPPRIAESPVALECERMQIIELGREVDLVLGRVLALHVRDDAVLDAAKHYIDTPALELIGRMHGAGWYARTTDLFEMPRIALRDWPRQG